LAQDTGWDGDLPVCASEMPDKKSVSVPNLHTSSTGVIRWQCQSHGSLVSPKIPAKKRPSWLTTKSLSKRTYLARSTGNIHALKSCDYDNRVWSMPTMFGDEKYGFTLVDIEDPRYVEEAALMGRRLVRLNYEQQILDMEWRTTYKRLLHAENHLRTYKAPPLPNLQAVATKTQEQLKTKIKEYKEYLLELQQQKDLYETLRKEIWDRCMEIKKTIRHENNLEELREEMTERVRHYFPLTDEFWQSKFNCRSVHMKDEPALPDLDAFEAMMPEQESTPMRRTR